MNNQSPPKLYNPTANNTSRASTKYKNKPLRVNNNNNNSNKNNINTGKMHTTGSFFSRLPLSILRFFQFASAVVVMSLIAFTISDYHFHGSRRANFGLSVGVIGTFYIMAVILLTLIIPKVVLAGPYLIAEIIMTLLWLCGFIVTAKVFGEHSCSNHFASSFDSSFGSPQQFLQSGGQYNPFTGKYTTNNYHRACQSSKASIAFSGLSFILGCVSCILLGVLVLAPIIKNRSGSGIWKTGSALGTQLHRFSGLTLTQPLSGTYDSTYRPDLETGAPPQNGVGVTTTAPAGEQHTISTGSTNNSYNQEKYAQPAEARVSGATATTPVQNRTVVE